MQRQIILIDSLQEIQLRPKEDSRVGFKSETHKYQRIWVLNAAPLQTLQVKEMTSNSITPLRGMQAACCQGNTIYLSFC